MSQDLFWFLENDVWGAILWSSRPVLEGSDRAPGNQGMKAEVSQALTDNPMVATAAHIILQPRPLPSLPMTHSPQAASHLCNFPPFQLKWLRNASHFSCKIRKYQLVLKHQRHVLFHDALVTDQKLRSSTNLSPSKHQLRGRLWNTSTPWQLKKNEV